jgi:hypothetical protein
MIRGGRMTRILTRLAVAVAVAAAIAVGARSGAKLAVMHVDGISQPHIVAVMHVDGVHVAPDVMHVD